jgi:hypothetical protein
MNAQDLELSEKIRAPDDGGTVLVSAPLADALLGCRRQGFQDFIGVFSSVHGNVPFPSGLYASY